MGQEGGRFAGKVTAHHPTSVGRKSTSRRVTWAGGGVARPSRHGEPSACSGRIPTARRGRVGTARGRVAGGL